MSRNFTKAEKKSFRAGCSVGYRKGKATKRKLTLKRSVRSKRRLSPQETQYNDYVRDCVLPPNGKFGKPAF